MKSNQDYIIKLFDDLLKDDQKAFEALYGLLYPVVYRFVRYFVQEEDAKEIVSEVFFKIWKNRERIGKIDNKISYVYRIAKNECYDFINKNKAYETIDYDDMPVSFSLRNEESDDSLVESEMMDVFYKAVDQLPERCKLIFLMVRVDQLKYKEVAEILSISVGTIEQQMNIAIKRVTDSVSIYYPSLGKLQRGNKFIG
ncbi:MAG: RNA polymerase sigma factor [Tannerellaceae bacterium]